MQVPYSFTLGHCRVMEAYENAKEEIEGENTVFQDLAIGWNSLMSRCRSRDAVTKYDAADEPDGNRVVSD